MAERAGVPTVAPAGGCEQGGWLLESRRSRPVPRKSCYRSPGQASGRRGREFKLVHPTMSGGSQRSRREPAHIRPLSKRLIPHRDLALLMDMSPSEYLSLADVKNRLSEVIETLEREHGRVVVTKHGRRPPSCSASRTWSLSKKRSRS
jgi:hypothetical protein